jgi:DNA-binding IscR family transcriptional regulator
MIELVESIDGLTDYRRCPGGMTECNDDQPCGMHDSWKALRDRIMEYLERTSIAELAAARDQKVKQIERRGRAKRSVAKK